MTLPISMRLALAALSLCAVPPAFAEVSDVSPAGFLITYRGEVKSDPAGVVKAIGQPSSWWNPRHTYSGAAANLSMELRAGGCFCERWAENSVEHARVLYVDRGKAVRLQGGLGPLQEMAVHALLHFSAVSAEGGSVLTMTYRVRGNSEAALDKIAPVVDRVIGEQFRRLAAFAGGEPLPAP